MATLPPTAHERIARCGTGVLLTGLVVGADVQLEVGGNVQSFSASGGRRTVSVVPLIAGDEVRARQDDGAGFSPWSPTVVVEEVELPPSTGPRLPAQVGACSHCVKVDGAVPGSRIELRTGPAVIGGGTANRHGDGCFRVDLANFGGDVADPLIAVMDVCGEESPPATIPITAEISLDQPSIIGPLFGCQQVVPLNDVHHGAMVRLESAADALGSFCSCWNRVDVNIGTPLVAGESVRVQPFWDGRGDCIDDGPWSAWEPVVDPDQRIAPTIQAPLTEGDTMIRVTGQILGASRLISIQPAGGAIQEWGPAPSSEEAEIALAEPLKAGSIVTVTQTLCSVSATSDPVVVQTAPQEVFAPVILAPLYDCGAKVQVSNLHPGALVRLFSDNKIPIGKIPIGIGYAGMNTSIAVDANPSLVKGREITATQHIGGVTSPASDPVVVTKLEELHRPRILGPVALGDRHVWVSGLTPGCRVVITSDGQLIGEGYVAESISRVPLFQPVDGAVGIAVDICGLSATGERMVSVVSPCGHGELTTAKKDLTFSDWAVPITADGTAFTTEMRGEVYFPANSKGELSQDQANLPVIIIAHGFWDEFWHDTDEGDFVPVESFRGYDYLGHHLASWGMLVFSVDMDDVNIATQSSPPQTHSHAFSRGEIILRSIDLILAHPEYGDVADARRIGLVGHSMGGEGVIAAQQLNRDEGRGYQIGGVVSIAPTRWHDDLFLGGCDYLQIFGSMDQLNFSNTGPSAHFAGVRFYDRGIRPKTHAWVHGLRHNPFNRRWVGTDDFGEASFADAALSSATHELVARCLINAFFQRAVFGRSDYAAYMEGIVLPSSLDNVAVHLQHSREPMWVVDNFGEADAQAGVGGSALDGSTNSEGLSIENLPLGSLDPLEDVELIGLADSSHDSKAVRFAWNGPGARYQSETAGSLPSPRAVLALRAAQFHSDDQANPPGVDLDLFVRLEDSNGNEAFVRLGSSATIPYPDHDLANDDGPDPLAMMRTVSLPADAFTAVEPSLNVSNLASLTLVMNARASGHVFIDDIEIWR